MHHVLSYFANKELSEMYIFIALRTLAFAMISIFVPIYILELGYGVEVAISYLVIIELFMLACYVLIPYIFSRLGFKNMMFTSTIIMIVVFLLLRQLQFTHVSFRFIAFLSGLATVFYWTSFHIHFKNASDKGRRGREFGILQTISMSMAVLAPLFGAFFIYLWGFDVLYFISSALMLFALVPFFMTQHNEHELLYNPRKVFKITKISFVHFCEGINNASALIFWPLFVYVVLQEISIVGIMSSLGMLLMALVTVHVGRVSDKDFMHAKTLVNLGSWGHAASQFLRIFALSIGSVFSVQLLGSLTRSYVTIPILRLLYDHKKLTIAEATVRREFFLHVGKVFAIVVSVIFGFSLIIPMILAGVAALGFGFIKENE
jgi:hypothetical protein